MLNATDEHEHIRDAVRDLAQAILPEYHRKIDEERGYPEAFVDALTKAGWLAAMIPEEYGGSGLGLTEASVIMEEINRCGGNSGAVPRPDVQHGHAAAPRLARSRSASTCRRSPAASCACSRWA